MIEAKTMLNETMLKSICISIVVLLCIDDIEENILFDNAAV